MIRGGSEHALDEIKRAVEDAVGDLAAAFSVRKVLAGAGATEIYLAKQLSRYADSLSGREQLAVQAFAQSLEIIPRTLAENGGLDPIDIFVDLRKKHNEGVMTAGVDPINGVVKDMSTTDIIEPALVKKQAITAAAEAAQMILRIDDVIASKGMDAGGPGGPGGPGGDDDDMDF